MLSAVPGITLHAAERAFERMLIARPVFEGWVAATWRDWVPVNAEHLRDFGVKVSAQAKWHFESPWTSMLNVALCVSEDNWLITVVTFQRERGGAKSKATSKDGITPRITKAEQKVLSSFEVAVRRIINDMGVRQAIQALLRPAGIPEDHLRIAIEQYAAGLRELDWLKHFVKMQDSGGRNHALGRRGRDLSAGEKQFITPAEDGGPPH